jgi:hypothetical protein
MPALRGRARLRRIAGQPLMHVEVVELLRPQQAGKRLPLHTLLVVGQMRCVVLTVEVVRLIEPAGDDAIEVRERLRIRPRGEAHGNGEGRAGFDDGLHVRGRLAALLLVYP